jgi:uncharacterized linocin/CFP29 family protein
LKGIEMDMIFNGQAHGKVADTLMQHGFNPLSLRPYLSDDGKYTCISVHNGQFNEDGTPKLVQKIIGNASATLRKDAWKHLDQIVVKASKPRLKAVTSFREKGMVFGIPNGLGTTVLETQAESDISPAQVSMDGLRKAGNDRPVYNLGFLPLPIVHKDFHYSARQIATAARTGSPLDTTSVALAARQVADETERLLLGTSTVADQYSFGGGIIYGLTDFPKRMLKSLTDPSSSAWVPKTLLTETLAMIEQARVQLHYGPFTIYAAGIWSQYMGQDYVINYPKTLRSRILELEEISDIKICDFLSNANYDYVMVQDTEDVARLVLGMDITTVMWDTEGGMQKNFKVMSIIVPQMRADYNDRTGIVHGTA